MNIDPQLTKQHFSTKVVRSYLFYIKNNYPEIDLPALCAEAGLPYEYLLDEDNWVSVVFARRFNELSIQKTDAKMFAYKSGLQSFSEESIGKPLFYLSKYLASLRFIYEQVGKFTELFSKVTQIEVKESRDHYIRLKFTAIDVGLNDLEKEALQLNFKNAFQNTIGHLAAIPSCQNLPPAYIEYDEIINGTDFPEYDIKIHYTATKVFLFNMVLLATPFVSTLSGMAAYSYLHLGRLTSLLFSLLIFFFISLILLFRKYSKLSGNFQLIMIALNNVDQRYLEVQSLKENLLKMEKTKALAELAASVAHDIRSPLAALGVALTVNGIPNDTKELAKAAVKRINEIAQDLLNRNKPISTHLIRETSIENSLNQIKKEKEIQFQHYPQFKIHFQTFLKAGTQVIAEAGGLQRILSNLINNAGEASSFLGNVWITATQQLNAICIEIKDDGIGMSPEILDRIGESKFSFGKTSFKDSGSGIAVYNAKVKITEWGGDLQFESKKEIGTTARIFLNIASIVTAPS
jgi:signal transduction histidine kinase